MQIARKRAELRRLRQPAERVLFGHIDQRHRAVHQLANPVCSQVAGRGRGRALAQKNPHSQTPRAGLLQRFHLAHAHIDAEFVALARYSLGVARASFHGLRHYIGGQGFKVKIRQIG